MPTRSGVRFALGDPDLRWVNTLLAVAVGVTLIVIGLRQVPEPFEAASDIGTAVSDLGIGYTAGWLFYYLTIWRPRATAKALAEPSVARYAMRVAGCAGGFLDHLCHSAGQPVPSDPIPGPDLAAMIQGLSTTAPTNLVARNGQQLTLAHGAADAAARTDEMAAKVERWAALVDPELLVLVYKVVDSHFLGVARQGHLFSPAAFGGLSGLVVQWFEDTDRLRAWVATYLQDGLRADGMDVVAAARGLLAS